MNIETVGKGPLQGGLDSVEQAVVQVFSQVVKFDWLEPYSMSEQYETRGSGFFIDGRGSIITSAHVVDQARSIWIQMPAFGQKIFSVELVGFCPERDMALLVLNQEDKEFIDSVIGGIPFLPLGNSDLLKRTDPVLVLGYPLGQYRVKSSTGVVSGWESGAGRSWIQITAPINPGNSGGPLVNDYGQVIGIAVSAVFPSQNVGYAIPINELKMILENLRASGLVRRANLGLAFNFGSDAMAKFLGNPVPAGLYICKVFARSLAGNAGIKPGDMLYEFNGLKVDAFGDVFSPWSSDKASIHDLLSRLPLGAPIAMVIYRNGNRHEISCSFDLIEPYSVRTIYPDYETVDYEVIAGMVVMQLTEDHIELLLEQAPYLLEYTKLEKRTDPVLVLSHLLPGSVAQLSRSLAPGAIIAELNGHKVSSLESFRSALSESISTGFLTVKTEDQVAVAFSFEAVVQDEARLADYFGYQLSDVLGGLL